MCLSKVWDVKGALTSRVSDAEGDTERPNNDNTDNRSMGSTTATSAVDGDDDDCNNNHSCSSSHNTTTWKGTDSTATPFSGQPPPSTQQLRALSSAPSNDAHFDDATSISSREEGESTAGAERSVGTAVVGEDSDESGGSNNNANSSAVKRGDSMLWPSEPSESIKGEDYGDR